VENRSDASFCRKCGKARASLEDAKLSQQEESSCEREVSITIHEEPLPFEDLFLQTNDQLAQPSNVGGPHCCACSIRLRVTDRFCNFCGVEQPRRPLDWTRACDHCNALLSIKARYCHSCGTEMITPETIKTKATAHLFEEEESELFPKFDA
jgi:ribosomal protein L40E